MPARRCRRGAVGAPENVIPEYGGAYERVAPERTLTVCGSLATGSTAVCAESSGRPLPELSVETDA